jgi:hypothetical protein
MNKNMYRSGTTIFIALSFLIAFFSQNEKTVIISSVFCFIYSTLSFIYLLRRKESSEFPEMGKLSLILLSKLIQSMLYSISSSVLLFLPQINSIPGIISFSIAIIILSASSIIETIYNLISSKLSTLEKLLSEPLRVLMLGIGFSLYYFQFSLGIILIHIRPSLFHFFYAIAVAIAIISLLYYLTIIRRIG